MAIAELSVRESPIKGRTFSLFGSGPDTGEYYRRVGSLADLCLQREPDPARLLSCVRSASRKKRYLARLLKRSDDGSLASFVLRAAGSSLAEYTVEVRTHLRNLSPFKRWDGTLLTTEQQYHLFMLEIELTNRLSTEQFLRARRKIAFLPYCLRDIAADCRSAPAGIDYACRGCSQTCFVNEASAVLRRHAVEPYLWMNARLKSLFRDLKREGASLGVLGIACVPELVRGMRLCGNESIPAVGLPLNANRCARWMGEFHATSVNLGELENLVRSARPGNTRSSQRLMLP